MSDFGTKQTKQATKSIDGDTYEYEYDNQGQMSQVTVTIGGTLDPQANEVLRLASGLTPLASA
ncbi:hypothetical protein [Botrimarina sp.]|uniref:hypothetical protein n=1 Tax=Botrimarina sp. TaxID=2795802 RepID=UPI0032ED0B38